MDREDFSINKRSRAHPLSCWPRQWNWLLAVDSGMWWIRSICCDRLRHFVRWQLCKCQQCTWVDAKIAVRNLHCTSRGYHFRCRWIAGKWKWIKQIEINELNNWLESRRVQWMCRSIVVSRFEHTNRLDKWMYVNASGQIGLDWIVYEE